MAGSDVDYSFKNSDQEISSLNIRDILQMLGKEFQKEHHVLVQKELNNCVLGLQKILSFYKNGDTSFFADDKFSALEKRLLDLEKKAEQHAALTKPSCSKPSYSDALKANITQAPERLANIVKSQSTPPPPVKTFRDRRLILKTSHEATQKIHDKAFLVRNRINDAFINANLTNKPVISCVSRSFKGYSVILMTTKDFSAEYLQEHNKLWQTVLSDTMDFDCNLEPSKFYKDEHWGSFVVHGLPTEIFNIDILEAHFQSEIFCEKDEKWGKFVLHDIPISFYNNEDGMLDLKTEIETYNSHISLKKLPIWLTNAEKRETLQNGSVLVITDTVKQSKLDFTQDKISKPLFNAQNVKNLDILQITAKGI
ncbi:hypothetical protein ACJ73_09181 [Blastomyces percursus]|uniref:Uncharacterized protein n=1 Tax=Blastomyces percursus TaxID=1658174 RepID=A0A1J9PAS1_9EURO|nr:hypothetical protein ACJ73_09181 [Blastomyces percursus]